MAQISNQVIKALYYQQDLILSEICQVLKCRQDINQIPIKITELLNTIEEQQQTISYYQEIIKKQQEQLLKYNINVNVSKKILNQETLSQLTINKQQKYLAQVLMENNMLRQENKELVESSISTKRQQLSNAIYNSSQHKPRVKSRTKQQNKSQYFTSPIAKPQAGIQYSIHDLDDFTMDEHQQELNGINDLAPSIAIKKHTDDNFDKQINEVNQINANKQQKIQESESQQNQSITVSSLQPLERDKEKPSQKQVIEEQQLQQFDIPNHEFKFVQFMDTQKLQVDDEREKLINSFVSMMNSGLNHQ